MHLIYFMSRTVEALKKVELKWDKNNLAWRNLVSIFMTLLGWSWQIYGFLEPTIHIMYLYKSLNKLLMQGSKSSTI